MSDLIHKEDAVYAVINAEPFLTICGGEWDGEVLQRASDVTKAIMSVPSADRPKNMIHIDEVYRLIAGHSNYHGDSILSAFTCLVEGKDVKPIAPLDESADRPTGKWVEVEEYDCVCYQCDQCKSEYVLIDGTPQDNDYNYCPHCGAKMGGEEA